MNRINYFPIGLNIKNRSCLVMGNDHEAPEKYARLKKSGARVNWVKKKFQLAQLKNKFMVMITLDVPLSFVKKAAVYARRHRILFCALDRPQFNDFANVSVYERGDLKINISTNGAAPAISKKIRLGLEKSLKNVPIEKLMKHLSALRPTYKKQYPHAKERISKLIAATEGFEFKAKIKLPKIKK